METTIIISFIILSMFLWFWAIIDISKSRFKNPTMNTVWYLIVLFSPVIGAIIYFQFRKNYVIKGARKFQPNFNRVA